MNGGDDADQKVQPHLIAGLQPQADSFPANASDSYLTVGLVGEGVVDVVRQLTVNADWLQTVQHGVAGSFEH
jgi:hypothetical protein